MKLLNPNVRLLAKEKYCQIIDLINNTSAKEIKEIHQTIIQPNNVNKLVKKFGSYVYKTFDDE